MQASPTANPNDELDSQYDNLTEKQRAVVDAHAQNPDATNREKARIAGEEILKQGEPVNESYCSEILNKKYERLAQYREEIEQNERPTGSMQTTGDPFEGLESDSSQGFQTIQERPTKQTQPQDDVSDTDSSEPPQQQSQRPEIHSSAPLQVADTGDGIAIKFRYEYAQELIESPESHLPPELQQRSVDVVFQRAFN